MLRRLVERRFVSREWKRPEDILENFLAWAGTQGVDRKALTAAAFGIAGPIVGNEVRATNLPWLVRGDHLARQLGLPSVFLLNDLEAAAHGLALLGAGELVTLNAGACAPTANQALIAAGTGLGEAILFWDGERRAVSATEGGHADFAPRTDVEIELLRYLKQREEPVDVERVVSGRGFRTLHEFLDPKMRHGSFDDPAADPAPQITGNAQQGTCPICVQAVDLWVSLFGAEAGNLALKSLARGGVYVAGGIAVKILDKLKDGTFLRAFCHKATFRGLLEQIPVWVVLDENLPTRGAAARAC